MSSDFYDRPVMAPPIWWESLTQNIPPICIVCGRNLERRHFVADFEELGNLVASEIDAPRLNAKEILTSRKRVTKIIFSFADGIAKLFGRDQEIQESTLRQYHHNFKETRMGLSSKNKRWRRSPQRLLVHWRRLHLSSSRRTSNSPLCAKWRIVPNTTEVHWLDQINSHKFGCDARKAYQQLLWSWSRSNFVRFEESIYEVYVVEWETSSWVLWSGRRLTKIRATTRPDYLRPEIWPRMSKAAQKKKKKELAVGKAKRLNAQKTEEYPFHQSERWRV